MRLIRLNFIAFEQQEFNVKIFRRKHLSGIFNDSCEYYDLLDSEGKTCKYEISNHSKEDFEEYTLPNHFSNILAARIYDFLLSSSQNISSRFDLDEPNPKIRALYFEIESHSKGKKVIWIEPYFLKSKSLWGVLIGFKFVVDISLIVKGKALLDKEILIASGALNSRGLSNLDFYLYKHEYILRFIKQVLPELNRELEFKLKTELEEVKSFQLKPKEYVFKDGQKSNSSYLGLNGYEPLSTSDPNLIYEFIYKPEDRNYAVILLKGLRGDTHPNTFSGMQKMFKVPFINENIKGIQIKSFSENDIDEEISKIKTSGTNTLPIIITNTKESSEDRQYYLLKSKFTTAGIPCQVVTKDLIQNENSLKYSLSNIGLQIFAKSGGKPWKMRPATSEYLIIGIGQSYNIEHSDDGNIIEKNITYSILTDSSGIFKDIKVLSEGEEDDTYWQKLVSSIVEIINLSESKRVVIHVPFRISKTKVLEKVSLLINQDIEFSVLVINSKSKYWGFDYLNNGLVPFESTFVKLSKYDYLVWFEGLLNTNPKITKRFGNPLKISFWYSNKPHLLDDYTHREGLLQDCINLSGANWRGFKSKQLPVSVFYCQRIAEFIAKFREYNLEHIELNNLKPWFL